MEDRKMTIAAESRPSYLRIFFALIFLTLIAAGAFALGIAWSTPARADDTARRKVVYPKKTELDFEGLQIEGELRNPGEFYFQHRDEGKFDSLVKRRKNFHREMLRDAVAGK
jgi:hypothetical protein